MMKKLLLFVMLLAGLNAHADNGTISVTNIKNVVPGYTGSFDIVLSGSDNTYCAYQFDLTLPTGLTYSSYANGELINGHDATVTDQGSNITRFSGSANPSANFTAKNGTLLTIYFTVASNYSEGSVSFSGFKLTLGTVTTNFTVASQSIPISTVITLDEDATSAPAAISNVNVTVNRTLKANVWNTIVLPFDMSAEQITEAFGNDAQVAELSDVEYTFDGPDTKNIKVSFSAVTEIVAHHPYIVKVTSAISSFSVSSVNITSGTPTIDIATDSKYKKFVGTYTTETTIPDGGLFLSDNQFKYSTGSSKLKAFRGYFDFKYKLDGYDSASAPAVTFDINGTTAIDAIEDGAIRTAQAQTYYNLAGQRVANPTKGIYIVNGKKVIVK